MLWFFIAGLLVIAVSYLLLPLFRTADVIIDDRNEQNVDIVREQMAELESSFEQGEIDSEQYHERRDELEQALLFDVRKDAEPASTMNHSASSRMSAVFLALFVPIAAVALYWYLGTPNAPQLAVETKVPVTASGEPDFEKLVANLHNKLRKAPNNAEGWYMLGRSYMLMRRFDGAVEAYENLYRLQPEEPDVMLMLADAMSMQQGKMLGRPEELINKALQKAPQNMTALWLSGMVLEQKGQYQAAIDRWVSLRPMVAEGAEERGELESLIRRAQARLSGTNTQQMPTTKAAPVASDKAAADSQAAPAKVVVFVDLSDKFKDQVSQQDSVFVYAKAQNGPAIPLAASRLKVKDLPAKVVLDDAMAMMPQVKLSMFDTLIVGARVSKTGTAVGQDGDLFTEQEKVGHGDEVSLLIDKILKK